MRVLYLIDSLHGGGAETSLVDLLGPLAQRGVQARVATLLPDDGALLDRLQATGTPVDLVGGGSPFRSLAPLRRLVAAYRPDLIHTTLLHADLVGRLVGRVAGVPVVTTLANASYGPEHRRASSYGAAAVVAVHGLDAATARLTRRFHAISRYVAEVMGRRLRIPARRIDVVYRGRDVGRLGEPSASRRQRVRTSLGLAPDTPVALCVARLDRQKAVEVAIRAIGEVRRRRPDAVLLVAGRPCNAAAEVEAAARAAGDGVRLLGHRTDVPDLMCAADTLVMASRWEGLGGAILEAMGLRLPVIATRIPPLVEALGGTGCELVPPDEPAPLAAALDRVLAGGPEVRRQVAAAHRRFTEHFTIDASADGMVAFYRRASGTAVSPAPTGTTGPER